MTYHVPGTVPGIEREQKCSWSFISQELTMWLCQLYGINQEATLDAYYMLTWFSEYSQIYPEEFYSAKSQAN